LILYRCFAWNASVASADPDGPLWFPRPFQGEGRHDNPDLYACLYVADRPVSCVVEQLAAFRGQRLTAAMLRRRALPLALAELELEDGAELIDFDNPRVLQRERLRPSIVATRSRGVTQPQARALFERRPALAGIKWWSVYEALWANVTVFDRAASQLRLNWVVPLTLTHPAVVDAAQFFGMRVAAP
jgi:hypothetical protein